VRLPFWTVWSRSTDDPDVRVGAARVLLAAGKYDDGEAVREDADRSIRPAGAVARFVTRPPALTQKPTLTEAQLRLAVPSPSEPRNRVVTWCSSHAWAGCCRAKEAG
jgi:hypothetical protein